MFDHQTDPKIPSQSEFESLFVNNSSLIEIKTHLNRFNPIRVMKMESMEIRHSAILAWLLDPIETHGLGDNFLKAFLGEALRNHEFEGNTTAFNVINADLRDTIIRLEWKNIDICIECRSNGWAFVVENKFHSKQGKNQLSGYLKKAEGIFQDHKVTGIFLTLWDEKPNDPSYATINYSDVCTLLELMLKHYQSNLSNEVFIFVRHYLDTLKDANDMNEKTTYMEELAKDLYREHKKVIDFVVEHGSSTDFAAAARMVFGDNPEHLVVKKIAKYDYCFNNLSNKRLGFLPKSWLDGFGSEKKWKGCEKWWAGYPLIVWIGLFTQDDGKKGNLRICAEVGPIKEHKLRNELMKLIKKTAEDKKTSKVKFSPEAWNEGKRYSQFLNKNTVEISDVQDAEVIASEMKKLIEKYQCVMDEIGKALPDFNKAQ